MGVKGYITRELVAQVSQQYYYINGERIQNKRPQLRTVPIMCMLDSKRPFGAIVLLRANIKMDSSLTTSQMWDKFIDTQLLPHFKNQGFVENEQMASETMKRNNRLINEDMSKGWEEDHPQHSWIT